MLVLDGTESRLADSDDSFSDGSFIALLRSAQAGSGKAAGELLQRFRPYLLLIANEDLGTELHGKLGASDVVQDAMISAQKAIGDFRGESPQELRGWLRRIVINDILQSRRKFKGTKKRQLDLEIELRSNTESRGGPPDPACTDLTPSSWVSAQEEAERLRRAMRCLSEEYQRVIELRNWQDMSFAEIGRVMDRSEEAACKLWSRAVLKLQKTLQHNQAES